MLHGSITSYPEDRNNPPQDLSVILFEAKMVSNYLQLIFFDIYVGAINKEYSICFYQFYY